MKQKKPKPNYTGLRKAYRYFFLNGKVYRLTHASWARDEAVAWDFAEKKSVMFSWSDIRRHAQRGFTPKQVIKIIHRTKRQLDNYQDFGWVSKPVMVEMPETGYRVRVYSEDDIYKIRDMMAGLGRGRPRKDGIIRPQLVPTREEIHAAIKYNAQLFIKTEDGEFVPLFEADNF